MLKAKCSTLARPSDISMKKLKGKCEANFDTPFIIQIRVESLKKIIKAL